VKSFLKELTARALPSSSRGGAPRLLTNRSHRLNA